MSDEILTTSIREVFDDERFTVSRALADYAFGASPSTATPEERQRNLESLQKYATASRFFVSFAGESPQATAVMMTMTENIRGKILPMSGVSSVASLPTGRRQGHVRNVLTRIFQEMRAEGNVISTLYPFRESFYERMGYVPFPRPRYIGFDPANLAPLVKQPKSGSIDQLPFSEGWELWRSFIEQQQLTTHGFSLRDRSYDVRNKDENTHWTAIARDDAGEIVGMLVFKITGYTERLEVHRFYTTNVLGRYLLLDWIGRHVDQVKIATICLPPDVFPETWYRDLNATVTTDDPHAWAAPSGRIIDVRGLTGIGAGDGEITVRIEDEFAAWNTGVFTFTGANGELTVTEGGEPQTTLTIQGLAALVFAGYDPASYVYRGWGDPDAASQATLAAIFPPAAPFLHELF